MKTSTYVSVLFIFFFVACDKGDENSPLPIEEEQNFSKEIFFSEYIEGTGFNKALEIVNLTGKGVDLSAYSIMKKINGSGEWTNEHALEGNLAPNRVYVLINNQADNEKLLSKADASVASPLDFNGDDPVALFNGGILIDLIGISGGENFAQDVTLRRKKSTTEPSTSYNIEEWDFLEKNTVDGLGAY